MATPRRDPPPSNPDEAERLAQYAASEGGAPSALPSPPLDAPLGPPSALILPDDESNMKWPRARAIAFLTSQPQVPVFIPLDSWERVRPGPHRHVFYWNGWGWPVTKGRQEMVPYPIAEIVWMHLSEGITQQYQEKSPWNSLIAPGAERTVRGETFGGRRLEM